MLGKVLKYEIKATARILLPFYPVIIILSLLNKLFFQVLDNNPYMQIPSAITMFIYVFLIIAMFVVTFIVMLQRFYKNLLGEEGYLSFTLPVKPATHIFSKLVTSVMWYIASGIVTLISIFIMLPSYEIFTVLPKQYPIFVQKFTEGFGMSPIWVFIPFLIALLVGIILSTLKAHIAMALGHLANKNRIICSFGAYVGVSIFEQTISLLVMTIVGFAFFDNFNASEEFIMSQAQGITMLNVFVYGMIALCIVLSIVYFIITKVILEKKLNLE